MRAVFCYDADDTNPQRHLPETIDQSFFDKLVVTHYAGTASQRIKTFYHYETWLQCKDECNKTWLVNINFPCKTFQINVVKGDDPKFMTGNHKLTWHEAFGKIQKIIPPTKEMLQGRWRCVSPVVKQQKLNVWMILQEFSDTRYSFLTPGAARFNPSWSRENNNCQSTHYKVVKMCLGERFQNYKEDIKPHMIMRIRTQIKAAEIARGSDYGTELEAIFAKKIDREEPTALPIEEPTGVLTSAPKRRVLSNQRLINRFIRESERIHPK